MAIDQFTHRSMSQAVKLLKRRSRFLVDKFFKQGKNHAARIVDTAELSYSPSMAPFVGVGSEGIFIEKETFDIKTVSFPKIRLKSRYSGLDLETTSINNPNIFLDTTPEEQMAADINDQLGKLKDMVFLRLEWMIAKMLTANGFTYSSNGVNYSINYQRDSHLSWTVSTDWDDSSANPEEDIMTMIDLILEYGATGGPAIMIYGRTAYNVAMQNSNFRALLNNRRMNFGAIQPISGEYYFGDIMGMEQYRYSLKDSDGNYLIPDKGIVFLSSPAVNKFFYDFGPVHESVGLIQTDFFSKMYKEEDPPGKIILLESNPLPMAQDINGTGIMYVKS